MLHRIRLPALALGAALAVGACDSLFGPDGERVVGVIEWTTRAPTDSSHMAEPGPAGELVARVVAPDTVTAGAYFTTVVTTVGTSGCDRAAGARSRVEGVRVSITPYDWKTRDEDTACPLLAEHFPRNVKVRFDRRGEAVLRVEGLRVAGPARTPTPYAVEKRIWVR